MLWQNMHCTADSEREYRQNDFGGQPGRRMFELQACSPGAASRWFTGTPTNPAAILGLPIRRMWTLKW
jgi:hypothetical protein